MIDGTSAPERTALYRMFDAESVLIYIGISKHFGVRWAEHAAAQPWWHEVQRQTVDWYPSREEAALAEVIAIKAEKPKYNVMHAGAERSWPALGQDGGPDPRRLVGFIADTPGEGSYMPRAPDVVAPGTYLITFGYDACAGTHAAVTVTQCVLVDAGDEVASQFGGNHRPSGAEVAGVTVPGWPDFLGM